ncbi:MAG TPA: GAF domain-containing protein [Kofleriaceae bacterium]|nr:GAF domain-containing protein [Kofleriaceae bacterium]
MNIQLDSLDRCFHGIVPGVIATADRDGVPNVSYVSQVHYLDANHVALSCQFFNKTRRNLDENPRASIEIYDPMTFEAYQLKLRFDHSEHSGPLFEAMALRIDAIASHTGMAGVFKLRSADVFEVLSIEQRAGFLDPTTEPTPPVALPAGPLTELRGLQLVSDRVNRAADLDTLLSGALQALDEVFDFSHGIIFVPDDSGERLVAVASHGYGDAGIGAEVRIGEGLIGAVAARRQLLRIACVGTELRYGRAIRDDLHQHTGAARSEREIPLPGLPDAGSQMAVPLLVQDRLVGVLALEHREALTFAQWHEAFLQVLANQIASGIDRMADRDDDDRDEVEPVRAVEPAAGARRRTLQYFRNDDCVFADGEYLIRNVPAKILWKLLRAHQADGRTEFANRELRLDPSLGLPAVKDNLESRLILLRKRLEQKCPEIRLVPTRRGRFVLELDCPIELIERETA